MSGPWSRLWEMGITLLYYRFLTEGGEGLGQGSQTRGPREGPMRPANIRINDGLKKNLIILPIFFNIAKKIKGLFFSLFQCSPRILFWGLMRLASQFELETPGLGDPRRSLK